jgi:hypothetical protein
VQQGKASVTFGNLNACPIRAVARPDYWEDLGHAEDPGDGYLSRLPEDQRDELTPVNGPGLTALREYLA